jgi:hypothetical protein
MHQQFSVAAVRPRSCLNNQPSRKSSATSSRQWPVHRRGWHFDQPKFDGGKATDGVPTKTGRKRKGKKKRRLPPPRACMAAARAARVSRDGLAVSRSHWAAWAFECPMIDLLISTWSAPGVRASRLVCHFRRVVGRSSQFSSVIMCISRLTIWLN